MTSRETPRSGSPAIIAGAEYELAFTDLLANGQAVGRTGGIVVFCFGPLPQERARVRITAIKPKYAIAQLVKLLVPSAFRTTPFCSVFGTCGGCQVQHLSYPAQLAWKTDMVRSSLQRIGGFAEVEVRGAVGMIYPRSYRNKMSLVVEHAGAGSTIGFYQQRSHEVVAIEACPIVTPQLNDYIGRLNRARSVPEVAAALAVTRHVVSRNARSSGESVVTFTTAQASPEVARATDSLMRVFPGAVGLTNSYDRNSQNAIMGRHHRTLFGRSEIEESIDGVRYRVSAGSFFQVNVEIVGRIFDFLRSGLEHPRRIVDLYCGAGTFALFFARYGCEVYGIEESSQAIVEAEENAALNGLENWVRFRAGRVEDIVRMQEARTAMREADIVFLDPPRKGSDEVTLGAIAEAKAPYVWYLSCDPATLARDLKFLAANGYRLGIVQPFDMFPQTGHVETLVTLFREAEAVPQTIAEAFGDVPPPVWPDDEFARSQLEYPDFVVRED
ncbi:MAG TPA: 23S rRNA (uracil(1939)-C(5))-methyltransferase RlmD [Candidatus Baltobacteraceae bacterium]|nr:23S rRNA (uracil(1939)-C(5))-methyltransferase RlmD [Candidatus Baltobacteraceae bacterium]